MVSSITGGSVSVTVTISAAMVSLLTFAVEFATDKFESELAAVGP